MMMKMIQVSPTQISPKKTEARNQKKTITVLIDLLISMLVIIFFKIILNSSHYSNNLEKNIIKSIQTVFLIQAFQKKN